MSPRSSIYVHQLVVGMIVVFSVCAGLVTADDSCVFSSFTAYSLERVLQCYNEFTLRDDVYTEVVKNGVKQMLEASAMVDILKYGQAVQGSSTQTNREPIDIIGELDNLTKFEHEYDLHNSILQLLRKGGTPSLEYVLPDCFSKIIYILPFTVGSRLAVNINSLGEREEYQELYVSRLPPFMAFVTSQYLESQPDIVSVEIMKALDSGAVVKSLSINRKSGSNQNNSKQDIGDDNPVMVINKWAEEYVHYYHNPSAAFNAAIKGEFFVFDATKGFPDYTVSVGVEMVDDSVDPPVSKLYTWELDWLGIPLVNIEGKEHLESFSPVETLQMSQLKRKLLGGTGAYLGRHFTLRQRTGMVDVLGRIKMSGPTQWMKTGKGMEENNSNNKHTENKQEGGRVRLDVSLAGGEGNINTDKHPFLTHTQPQPIVTGTGTMEMRGIYNSDYVSLYEYKNTSNKNGAHIIVVHRLDISVSPFETLDTLGFMASPETLLDEDKSAFILSLRSLLKELAGLTKLDNLFIDVTNVSAVSEKAAILLGYYLFDDKLSPSTDEYLRKSSNLAGQLNKCEVEISAHLEKDDYVKIDPNLRAFVKNYEPFTGTSLYDNMSHSPLTLTELDPAGCGATADSPRCYVYPMGQSINPIPLQTLKGYTLSPPDFFTTRGTRGSTAGDLFRSGVGYNMYDNTSTFIVTDGTCVGFCATFVNRVKSLNLAQIVGVGGTTFGEETRLSVASGPTGSTLCNSDMQDIMDIISANSEVLEMPRCRELMEELVSLPRGNTVCVPYDVETTFYNDDSLWAFEEILTKAVVRLWHVPSEESPKDSLTSLYAALMAYVKSSVYPEDEAQQPFVCSGNERVSLRRTNPVTGICLANEATRGGMGAEGWVGMMLLLVSGLMALSGVVFVVVKKSLFIYRSKPRQAARRTQGQQLEISSTDSSPERVGLGLADVDNSSCAELK